MRVAGAGVTGAARCFLCRAAMWAPSTRRLAYAGGRTRAFPYACGSCGVLAAGDVDPAVAWAELSAALARPTFEADPGAAYGLDLYTLRTAATRLHRAVRPLDAAGQADLRAPHAARAARAGLADLAAPVRADHALPGVSLGLLCRPADLDALLGGLPGQAAWTDDVVVLVDRPAEPARPVAVPGYGPGQVRLAARPLDGDFAGQRNALQALARRAWMLQLDADETLAPATGAALPALAALAEVGAALSIGLARENRVDGVLSEVYPDVQYRLNRADVRFHGRVHERPEIGGWQRGFISLHGPILHRLTHAHVRARSRRYEAIDPGRGRLEEEAALLRPYRD